MDGVSVGDGYAEHITEADLRLISAATGLPEAGAGRLRRDPGALERVLADPRLFEAIFGAEALSSREAVIASPFLAFAVAVHRAAADLPGVRYVAERAAARQQVPVFDAPELRDFLGSAARRLFLAELLTSFTRVTSGLTVVGEVADRFRQARRVLNHVADRYLIGGSGMGWFAAPGR